MNIHYWLKSGFLLMIGLQIGMVIAENKSIACNGSLLLCSKRYNDVVYPASHNAQSYLDSAVCNQDIAVTEQLERGIRAMKVHVWLDRDEKGKSVSYVCHGITKELLEEPYLEKIIEKVPALLKPFARSILKEMEPLNNMVRDACRTAYGLEGQSGMIQFKHCILDAAAKRLDDFLKDILLFLELHPHEVLTIILEDHTNDLSSLANSVSAAGLDRYLHTQDVTQEWPTLQQMVAGDKRLVLFVHGDDKLPYANYPTLHKIWDFAWDTEWDFETSKDLKDCAKDQVPKRGMQAFQARSQAPHNKLFIVYHFVTERAGGSKSAAKRVNKRAFLKERLERLSTAAHHIPNIVQVDFFEYPNNDLFAVVDELNGIH